MAQARSRVDIPCDVVSKCVHDQVKAAMPKNEGAVLAMVREELQRNPNASAAELFSKTKKVMPEVEPRRRPPGGKPVPPSAFHEQLDAAKRHAPLRSRAK